MLDLAKVTIDEDECIGCGACYEECSYHAIQLHNNIYQVNQTKCKGGSECYYPCLPLCPVCAICKRSDFNEKGRCPCY